MVDFAHAVNAEIVTSFTTSAGNRNANGVWTPKQADEWLAYTKSLGGRIDATEFMNEPTYAAMGGAPKDMTPRHTAAISLRLALADENLSRHPIPRPWFSRRRAIRHGNRQRNAENTRSSEGDRAGIRRLLVSSLRCGIEALRCSGRAEPDDSGCGTISGVVLPS